MDKLNAGPFVFDLVRRQLFRDGEQISLTSKEYDLALFFFRHPGEVCSRRHLLEVVWDTSADIHTRTVDAHVSRLRQKLRLTSTKWELAGIYKHGYCLKDRDVRPARQSEAELDTSS